MSGVTDGHGHILWARVTVAARARPVCEVIAAGCDMNELGIQCQRVRPEFVDHTEVSEINLVSDSPGASSETRERCRRANGGKDRPIVETEAVGVGF